MPVPSPRLFREMLRSAREGGFALPAFNVGSLTMANAVLSGLASRRSDGFVQITIGSGRFASGTAVDDPALGAISIAEHVHRVAERYDILVALHTDHCPPERIERFLLPLVAESERRVASGRPPLMNGHMFDGSALTIEENVRASRRLLERLSPLGVALEVEIGRVGGDEEGAAACGDPERREEFYATPEEMIAMHDALSPIGGFLLAATFGNVHGVRGVARSELRPEILARGMRALREARGEKESFSFVFHGGSGVPRAALREAIGHGVVKVNVSTELQYAFSRAVADHMFRSYDKVLRVDGDLGDKDAYRPETYLRAAEEAMSRRVAEVCDDVMSAGRTLVGR